MARAAKTALLLGVLLFGISRVAAAQRSSDSVATEPEPRALAPVSETTPASLPVYEMAGGRGRLAFGAGWLDAWRAAREERRARWMLAGIRMGNTGMTWRDTVASRGMRRLNRKFLPIPLLRWQGYTPIGPRGLIALNPSLVIGRRPTFMSTICRSGRTFGVAVEVRIRFDAPPAPAAGGPARDRDSVILSTVRGFLDRNR